MPLNIGVGAKKVSVDILLTFSRQFLAGLLQLGIIMIVARELGNEGMGSYTVSLLLPTLLSQLLNLGLVSANVYFIASKQFEAKVVWGTSRDMGIAVGILGTSASGALVFFWGETVFPGVPLGALILATLIFPISLMSGLVGSFFQASHDFRSYNLIVLIQPIAALLGVLFLIVYSAFTLNNLIIVTIFSHLCALVVGGRRLQLIVPVMYVPNSRSKYLKTALKYGIKAHLGGIATLLINRSDMFMVNLFLGPSSAGIYAVAVRIIQQMWMVSQAVSTVIFPRLSSMPVDSPNRLHLVSLMSSAVFWGGGVIAFFIALFSEQILNILFGESFEQAKLPLMILLSGVLVFSSSRVLANDFAARNLVHINLVLTVTTLVINMIANIILIPKLGLAGAAIATSASFLFNFIARIILQQKITGLLWWRSIYPDYFIYKVVKKITGR